MSFPFYKQPNEMACRATCLRIIATCYGKNYNVKELLQVSGTTREGANLQGISQVAEKIEFRTLVNLSLIPLSLPCYNINNNCR